MQEIKMYAKVSAFVYETSSLVFTTTIDGNSLSIRHTDVVFEHLSKQFLQTPLITYALICFFTLGGSGGPLLPPHFVNDSFEDGDPSLDLILGVISMGEPCKEDMDEASMHTDIRCFLDWINDII